VANVVLHFFQDAYLGVSVSCCVVSLDEAKDWVSKEDNLGSHRFFFQEERAVRVFDTAASIHRFHGWRAKRREWRWGLGHGYSCCCFNKLKIHFSEKMYAYIFSEEYPIANLIFLLVFSQPIGIFTLYI
jgi:hypothetical protein